MYGLSEGIFTFSLQKMKYNSQIMYYKLQLIFITEEGEPKI